MVLESHIPNGGCAAAGDVRQRGVGADATAVAGRCVAEWLSGWMKHIVKRGGGRNGPRVGRRLGPARRKWRRSHRTKGVVEWRTVNYGWLKDVVERCAVLAVGEESQSNPAGDVLKCRVRHVRWFPGREQCELVL